MDVRVRAALFVGREIPKGERDAGTSGRLKSPSTHSGPVSVATLAIDGSLTLVFLIFHRQMWQEKESHKASTTGRLCIAPGQI